MKKHEYGQVQSKWYNEINKLSQAKDEIEMKMHITNDSISMLKGTSEDEDAKTLSDEVLREIKKQVQTIYSKTVRRSHEHGRDKETV